VSNIDNMNLKQYWEGSGSYWCPGAIHIVSRSDTAHKKGVWQYSTGSSLFIVRDYR